MSERREFVHILKTTKSDASVLIITFLLTVFINLTFAVEVGFILAFVLFVKRMSELLKVMKVLPDHSDPTEKTKPDIVLTGRDCPQINIFTVEGPLFFGAAQLFEMSILDRIQQRPKVLILKMSHVPMMDATGERNLLSLVQDVQKHQGRVLIVGIQKQPLEVMKKSDLYDVIGEQHFFETLKDAISYALTLINQQKCMGCKHLAFHECSQLCQGGLATNKVRTERFTPSLHS